MQGDRPGSKHRALPASIRSLLDKGFLPLLSANVLGQFLGFVTSLVITKFLAPVQLGEIKILQSYVILFLVLAGYGFSAAVLKYCAEDREPGDKAGLLRRALGQAMGVTAVLLAVVAVLALTGIVPRTARLSRLLLAFCGAVPFIVIYDILIASLQASKRIPDMARMQAVYKTITFVLVAAGTWRWGVRGFVGGTLVASVVGLLPFLRVVDLRVPALSTPGSPPGYRRMVLFSSLTFGVTTLGQYGDILIMDHFVLDRAAIGHYSLATYFVLAATQVTMTVQAVLIPYFSEHGRDRAWFDRHLLQNQLLSLGLGLVVAAGVNLAAWVLIGHVYGPSYEPALLYLRILSLRYILFSGYAIISGALIGLAMVKYNFLTVVVVTPLGLLLAYGLQRSFGVVGVAWAQVAAAALALALQLLWVRRARRRLTAVPV